MNRRLTGRILFGAITLLSSILLSSCYAPYANNSSTPPQKLTHVDFATGSQGNLFKEISRQFSLIPKNQSKSLQTEISWYSHSHTYLSLLANNSRPYIYYIFQETEKRHMPAEVALMPMVESNYSPFAVSRVGAVGLWQMMPGTASGFGLTINWWYDGRRDVVAATNAALDYMVYLHGFFGNWLLAMAAYDSGEGTVQAAIRKNRKAHLPTDFWDLPLPAETKSYVPKVLALAYLIKHPQDYQINWPVVPNSPYFKAVDIGAQLDIDEIAKLSKSKSELVRLLNPAFRRWATAPNMTYALLIPTDKYANFQKQFAALPKSDRVTWQHHVIKPGEALITIAKKYHTSLPIIKAANHLHSDLIHPGKDLLVPISKSGKISIHFAKLKSKIAEDKIPGPQRISYTIKRSDNLWTIARRYHLTPRDIRFWNKLTYHESLRLKPGKRIIIWAASDYRPPSRLHFHHYKVKPGDTISQIAAKYHTTWNNIKRENHLKSDLLHIGEKLTIQIMPRHHIKHHHLTFNKHHSIKKHHH